MMNRVSPSAAPDLAFTPLELQLLDQLISNKGGADPPKVSELISSSWPDSAVTWHAHMMDLRATRSHGEVSCGSPISTSAFSWALNLWVIEREPDAYRRRFLSRITPFLHNWH
jgi:hypothetical protein